MMLSEIPAIVLALLTWLNAPSDSFADVARREAFRRSLVGQSTRALTNNDLPVLPMGAEAPPSTPPPAAGEPPPATGQLPKSVEPPVAETEKRDEQWWRDRMAAARQGIERNRLLADALQSRINALATDIVNRDDPAQRAVLMNDRQKALDELANTNKQVELLELEITKIRDEARRLGVPPGWIR